MEINTKDLEVELKSLLISSAEVMTANKLFRDYEDFAGTRFPFRKLGFETFVDYLKSIPHVVKLQPYNAANPEVIPCKSEASAHVDQLVTKQRLPSKKGNSRRGGYNGRMSRRPAPKRRSAIRDLHPARPELAYRPPLLPGPGPAYRPLPLCSQTSYKFFPMPRYGPRPRVFVPLPPFPPGVHVRDIENNLRERHHPQTLMRNGIHSAKDVLHYASDMVELVGDKVYPKMSSQPDMSNHSTKFTEDDFDYYEDEEDSDYDLEYKSNGDVAGANGFANGDIDYKGSNMFDDVSEEQLSLYTINKCSKSPALTSNGTSTSAKHANNHVEDDESNFSPAMIRNFRHILTKHPNGVWAKELPDKYQEEFGVPLEIQDLGYSSVISMVASLPNVFVHKRERSDDWKLYDARVVSLEDLEKDEGLYSVSECNIPKSIVDNIKLLLKQNNKGFRSTDLERLYVETFNKVLDYQTLGFKRFHQFIESLRGDITITKSGDYYVMLPKLTTLEQVPYIPKSEISDLTLPLCTLGLDDVMKPGDTIPRQKLPDFVDSPSPHDPLLEIDVRIGEVYSPTLFYFMLDERYMELETMMEDLTKMYNLVKDDLKYKIHPQHLVQYLYCTCIYLNDWHRARITNIRGDVVDVEFIDYGTPGVGIPIKELRYLHKDYSVLPAQSLCAKLGGIQSTNKVKNYWTQEVKDSFLAMVSDKRLFAQVYRVSERRPDAYTKLFQQKVQFEIFLFDTSAGNDCIIFNDYLIEQGVAELIKLVDEDPERSRELQCSRSSDVERYPKFMADIDLLSATEPPETPSLPSNICPAQSGTQSEPVKRTTGPPPGFEKKETDSDLSSKVFASTPQSTLNQPTSNLFSNNAFAFSTQSTSTQSTTTQSTPFDPYLPVPQQHYQINNYFHPLLFASQTGLYSNPLPPQQPFFPNIVQNQFPGLNYPPVVPNNQLQYWPANLIQPQLLYQHTVPPPSSVVLTSILPQPVRVPGRSVDLSLPQRPSQESSSSNTPLVRQSTTPPRWFTPPPAYHQRTPPPHYKQVTRSSTPSSPTQPTSVQTPSRIVTPDCVDLTRPTTPLTPASAEVARICNRSRNDTENSYSSNQTRICASGLVQEESDEELAQMLNKRSSNSVESQPSNSSKVTESSTTDEYSSAVENIDDVKTSATMSSWFETFSFHSACESEDKTNDKIPDSWEDIDPDDTPAKADNFDMDFKQPLDITFFSDEYKMKLKPIDSNPTLNHGSSVNNGTFPINWKDTFDPDVLTSPKRIDERLITSKSQSTTKTIVKKVPVQKLEIDGKSFHLILVKDEPAVLVLEFYCQFTHMQMPIIAKIIEAKYKPFPIIRKLEEPALFDELQKLEFFGGANKKVVLRLGKAQVSYLSEVPEVFNALNLKSIKDRELLAELKRISEELRSC